VLYYTTRDIYGMLEPILLASVSIAQIRWCLEERSQLRGSGRRGNVLDSKRLRTEAIKTHDVAPIQTLRFERYYRSPGPLPCLSSGRSRVRWYGLLIGWPCWWSVLATNASATVAAASKRRSIAEICCAIPGARRR